MSQETSTVLQEAEVFVVDYLDRNLSDDYTFHNSEHTRQVVKAIREICNGFDLTEHERELLELAGWFHDTGYVKGKEEHEKSGCKLARIFMDDYDYSEEDVEKVHQLIMATCMDASPNNLLEEIISDADLSHLGKDTYWDLTGKLRMELTLTRNIVLSEQEWVEKELDFMESHQYHTYVAHELFNARKQKHIRQLHKRKLRLDPNNRVMSEDLFKQKKRKKKRKKLLEQAELMASNDVDISQLDLGRGVETMFRAAYRTHINLSAIADNKANIMLSINAIIVSITLSTLLPLLNTQPNLIVPTLLLLTVCLLSIVYATLSTRPKLTGGKFTREDIDCRRANLLFFANYYNMPLDEYQYGMTEMIKDSDFLYSSMTRDLYFLGVVLAKKYRYLSITYNIFMYGLILTVIAFAAVYLFF